MKVKNARDVRDKVEQEGFEYAFMFYSDFPEIKDEEFHKLRKAFIEARTALADYIGFED